MTNDRSSKFSPITLMGIPVIERIILAKLEEVKLIAEEEIKSFFEGT